MMFTPMVQDAEKSGDPGDESDCAPMPAVCAEYKGFFFACGHFIPS